MTHITTTADTGSAPPVIARRRHRVRLGPVALLALPMALICVTLAYPLERQIVMSFQKYGLAQQFGQPATWVGADNYRTVLTDSYFWTVVLRSLAFCAVVAAVTMVIGIAVAVLMQHISTGVRIYLSICLMLVWAMPAIASLTVWEWIFDARLGVLNKVLTGVGLHQFEGYSWLTENPVLFLAIVGIIVVWQSLPLVAVTLYAALTQVGQEVLEAASIDGATFWKSLRHIVLPIIRPIVLLIGVLQVIWDFRVFTQVYVLQQSGGIADSTNVLGTYVYEIGIGKGDYGTASALAMIMLVIALAMTVYYIRALTKQGEIG